MKIRSRILLPLAPALLGLPGAVLAASPARDPRVEIVTDMGTIVVQLAPSRAPRTVENFLRYVREGHYAGTVFHRVIQGFMIQGGGFTAEMQQKPVHDPIPLEARGGQVLCGQDSCERRAAQGSRKESSVNRDSGCSAQDCCLLSR